MLQHGLAPDDDPTSLRKYKMNESWMLGSVLLSFSDSQLPRRCSQFPQNPTSCLCNNLDEDPMLVTEGRSCSCLHTKHTAPHVTVTFKCIHTYGLSSAPGHRSRQKPGSVPLGDTPGTTPDPRGLPPPPPAPTCETSVHLTPTRLVFAG